MPGFAPEIIGTTYWGNLTYLGEAGRNKYSQRLCLYRCGKCGNEKALLRGEVVRGTSKSCGCQRTHGLRDQVAKQKAHTKAKVGTTPNFLTILSVDDNSRAVCECICGDVREYRLPRLPKSCGCLLRDLIMGAVVKHGDTRNDFISPEYRAWINIKTFCYNPAFKSFKNYGGRGIKLCDRWHTYQHFLEDLGRKPGPGYIIGRIDPDLDYTPENCKWMLREEYFKCKRRNRQVFP